MASSTAASMGNHGEQGQHGHRVHHRHKKSNDPFLTRSLTAEVSEQFRKPSPGDVPYTGEQEPSTSLLADLTVTPLITMLNTISFVFSLVLVDRQQRQWRLSQHNPDANAAGWSRAWLGPEPYQVSSASVQAGGKPSPEKGGTDTYSGWYTRKKKRAMARMEISDAFEMRKRVVFALLVWTGLTVWAFAYILITLYRWITGA